MNTKTTFAIVTMNMRDGSVQGHKAGCADLKRGVRKYAEPFQADCVIEVASKREAWEDYNADFIAEGGEENAYDIEWLPCANHVPTETEPAECVCAADFLDSAIHESTCPRYAAPAPVEDTTDEVTMKVCGKWTRFYCNGFEVGRILNGNTEAVASLLSR